MSAAVQKLVIVGRDAPVWLSACVMQYALAPAGVDVTVVELPAQAQPADVWITLPAIEPLHTRLRIDESRLIAATRGAFSLGRRFVDTTGNAPAFFHPHGSVGSRIDKKEFLPQWLTARRQGYEIGFEAFSLAATAARQGRMLVPDAAIDRFGFTDYAYHLPAIPYAAWLRQIALRRGVRCHAATTLEVRVDEQQGISALVVDGGQPISGDFFLDVTGSEALLANALRVGRESWRDGFAADRVLTALGALRSPVPIYSEVRAQAFGWTALASSQVCIHTQQAYSSDLVPDAAALEAAASMSLQNVVIRERHPGRRLRAWEKNCVAIGEAACVFDPLHFVDLHAVQIGLVHLLPLFPVQAGFDAERVEYNQNVRNAFSRTRDFQSAHYHLNRYGNSSFWLRSRAAALSAELTHKLGAFRSRGEAVDYEDEAFTIDDWRSLMIGHGVLPETHDPAVDRTEPALRSSELRRFLAFIQQKVEEQRTHADYLQTACAPAVPAPRIGPGSRIQQ